MLRKVLLTLFITTTVWTIATAVVAINPKSMPQEVVEPASNIAAAITLFQSVESHLIAKESSTGLTKKEFRKLRKVQRKIKKLNAQPAAADNVKSWLAALLFSILLGGLAIDRFYLGYVGLGIFKLLTLGGLGIWYLVDIILIATESLKPKYGYYGDDSF